MNKLFLILLVAVLWSGCQSAPTHRMKPELIVTSEERIHLSNTPLVKKALYAQFDEWKSVQYRLGGLSKKGIDCSGFVYVTYRNQLGITLPRTTELQSTVGRKVSQQNLHAGDLVFFKTGFFTRHVGIYLENRKFLHASTSKGVMISSLDNAYWSEKYWQSIRVKI